MVPLQGPFEIAIWWQPQLEEPILISPLRLQAFVQGSLVHQRRSNKFSKDELSRDDKDVSWPNEDAAHSSRRSITVAAINADDGLGGDGTESRKAAEQNAGCPHSEGTHQPAKVSAETTGPTKDWIRIAAIRLP
jgi:hypothetical protein